ncbi:MAG: hypothetical protein U9Q96_01350 [Patescibacteria group bacterium]|nr:hypothetical protein [Patescibacteria group bacterium]
MTKKFKKRLFFGLCLLFLITSPSVIFYCLGYRVDFENMKIVQTGGFFFKISPPGVTVNLDHTLRKKTNFFFDSAFINGLVPKNYEVTIKKTDYHPWVKTLKVEEQQVTEAKNIILFPQNPKFSLIDKNIKKFFPSPDGKEIILKIEDKTGWILNAFNIETQKQAKLVSEQELLLLIDDIKNNEISLLNLIWSNDSKRIILEISTNGQKQYLVLKTGTETNLFILDAEIDIKKISFNPTKSEELFFIAPEPEEELTEDTEEDLRPKARKQAIFRLTNDAEQIMLRISSPSFEQNIISYSIINNDIVWLADSGFLYLGQLVNSNKIQLNKILNIQPINIHEETNYQIITKDFSKIFLKQDETLYYLNSETHLLEQIFNSVKTVKFSEDLKKIIISTNDQIWLYYIEEEYEQPQRKIGEKILLAGFPNEVNNLFWLNNFYIIFQIKDSIKIAEIDDRSNINLIELTTFPSPSISWLEKEKTFFVLSKNNLYFSSDILK